MKKKLFCLILSLSLLLCGGILTGCGEQFIEERTYNMLGMTVIKDNTPYIYSPFHDGEYYTSFCGGMSIEKAKLEVGRKKSILVFEDAQYGIKAVYSFEVYTKSDVYPAYAFKSATITINGKNTNSMSQEQLDSFDSATDNLYSEVKQFTDVCSLGDTSIQLITQNKSLMAHIIVLDKLDGSLLFMGMVYGY